MRNKLPIFETHCYKLKTMVRYRLLFLTTAPIFITMFALLVITVYWSIHYTWKNTLLDVSERLHTAYNTVEVLQNEQYINLLSFSNSYEFHVKLEQLSHLKTDRLEQMQDFATWISEQRERYGLDFLTWHDNTAHQKLYLSRDQKWYFAHSIHHSFFDVLTHDQLEKLQTGLSVEAKVPYLDSNGAETKGLVSRAVLPVKNSKGKVIGYLDGGWLLNNSSVLVEKLCNLIYPNLEHFLSPKGTVTIFLNDLRVSTNIFLNRDGEEVSAVGSHVADNVRQAVLEAGNLWVDKAYVYDSWYITAYMPIKDYNDKPIGMLFTGYLVWPFVSLYLLNLAEIGAVILAVLFISGVLVYRGSKELFRPIEKIYRVVKQVQQGQDTRIGVIGLDEEHELTLLAKQFDEMLDLLQLRNDEIQLAAQQLEQKVQTRTASLEEKTAELKHHIKLLNQTRNKLVTNEKLAALGELTAGIAHEINNPTAVILGNVELLKLELSDNYHNVEEEIEAILSQIDRIRNITRSLLQYSRHGGVQDEITWHYINPIVDESITLVKTASKKLGIIFDVTLNAKTQVEINRSQLLQVLVNVQMNALHASAEKGYLYIRSEDWYENDQVKGVIISIKDEGQGIPSSQLKRIFDPFYTTKRDGTGLGLSVSQSILSRIGGEITVESTHGEGSCFKLYLPAKVNAIEPVVISQ